MDPAWSTCHRFWQGLYDPPIALTPVAGLLIDPITTLSDGSLHTLVAAQPLPTISAPVVYSTTRQFSDLSSTTSITLLPALNPPKGTTVNNFSGHAPADLTSNTKHSTNDPTKTLEEAVAPSKTQLRTKSSSGQELIHSGFVVVSSAASNHAQPNTGGGGTLVTGSNVDPSQQAAVAGNPMFVSTNTMTTAESTFSLFSRPGKAWAPVSSPGDLQDQKPPQENVGVTDFAIAQGIKDTTQYTSLSKAVGNAVTRSYTPDDPASVGVSVSQSTLPPIVVPQLQSLANDIHTVSSDQTLKSSHQIIITGTLPFLEPEGILTSTIPYALTSPNTIPHSPLLASDMQQSSTIDHNSIITADSFTLSAEDPSTTLSDTAVSVLPSYDEYLTNNPNQDVSTKTASRHSVFTVQGQIFTDDPTGYSTDGTTIRAEQSGIPVSGTVISELRIGSSTVPLGGATIAGLGGVIASAFGGEIPKASTSNIEPFQSTAAERNGVIMWIIGLMCLGVGVLIVTL